MNHVTKMLLLVKEKAEYLHHDTVTPLMFSFLNDLKTLFKNQSFKHNVLATFKVKINCIKSEMEHIVQL